MKKIETVKYDVSQLGTYFTETSGKYATNKNLSDFITSTERDSIILTKGVKDIVLLFRFYVLRFLYGKESRINRAVNLEGLYSLIFFNVQGGACQFLIDNDKVDHYI